MKICKIFKEVQEELRVSGVTLHRKTGISTKHISQFRGGANITTDKLDLLLSAIEELYDVKIKFVVEHKNEKANEPLSEEDLTNLLDSPDELLQRMTSEQIANLFYALGNNIKSRKVKDTAAVA